MKNDKVLNQIKSNLKTVATLTVGLGVGEIVASAVKEYKTDAKGLNKLFIKLGAVALTGMIVAAVNKHVEDQIDECFDLGEKMYEKLTELANKEDGKDATDEDENIRYEGSIPFVSKEEAEKTLEEIRETFSDNGGVITKEQVFDICGLKSEYSDRHYGWRELMHACVEYRAPGYAIKLPNMVRLE